MSSKAFASPSTMGQTSVPSNLGSTPQSKLPGQFDIMDELQAALHVYDYAAWIPEVHIRPFMRALGCLSQIGPDVVVEAEESGLILRTLNQSKSAYAQITLDKKRFLELSEFSAHVKKQCGSNPCSLKVLANLKACIMPLKNPQGLIFALSYSQSSIAFISVFSGGRSRSTYVVRAEPQSTGLEAQFQRRSVHNELSGRVILFTRFLQGTQSSHRELSLECTLEVGADGGPTGTVTLRSHSDNQSIRPEGSKREVSTSGVSTSEARATEHKVITEYNFAADEFETFDVTREYIKNPLPVSVSLKEVKAVIGFIDMLNPKEGLFHIWFDRPGLPVLFSNCENGVEDSPLGLQCDLIITSIVRSDEAMESSQQSSQDIQVTSLRQAQQMSQVPQQAEPYQASQPLLQHNPQSMTSVSRVPAIQKQPPQQHRSHNSKAAPTSPSSTEYESQHRVSQASPTSSSPNEALSSQELSVRPSSSLTKTASAGKVDKQIHESVRSDSEKKQTESTSKDTLGLGRPRHRQGGEEAEEEQEEYERLQNERALAAQKASAYSRTSELPRYYQDSSTTEAGGYAYPAPEDHGQYFTHDEFGRYPDYYNGEYDANAGGVYGAAGASEAYNNQGEQFYADEEESTYHSSVFASRSRRDRLRDEDVDDYYE